MANIDPIIDPARDVTALRFLEGGGAVGAQLAAIDWTGHPLGAPRDWSTLMKVSVSLCLRSSFPCAIYWGPDLRLIYNDAWVAESAIEPIVLGERASVAQRQTWPVLGASVVKAMAAGERLAIKEQKLILLRDGKPTETYWTYTSAPIVDDEGVARGMFNQGFEVTAHILAERALRATKVDHEFILTLVEEQRVRSDADDVMQIATEALGKHLKIDRVGFFEACGDGMFAYGACWVDGALPPMTGTFPVAEFGDQMRASIESGVTLCFDSPADPRAPNAGVLDRTGTKAGMSVPLIRDGAWQGAFYVSHAEPRVWTREEKVLIEEVAELSWDAVGRTRAVARLRAMNANLTGEVAERTAERDKLWDVSNDLLGIAAKDGRWLTVNPAWERLLGWTEAEIVGRDTQWLRHPEDTGGSAAEIARIAASGTTHRLEKRLRTRDGDYRTFAWQTTLLGDRLYANARDITEERRHEAASAAADTRTRMALDAVEGVGVWTYDIAQDRYDIDLGYAKLYGIEAGDFPNGLLPPDMASRIHPDDRPSLADALERSKTVGESAAHEYRLVMPDGALRWVMARNVVQRDAVGRPVKIVGVGIDITRQRELNTRFG